MRIDVPRRNQDWRRCQRACEEAAATASRRRRAQVENQTQAWKMERETDQRGEDVERRRRVAEQQRNEEAGKAADPREGPLTEDESH
jgi:hypothetical protein